MSVMRSVKNYFPDIAWKVLINLLPNHRITTSGTHKPIFRNPIVKDWKPTVTNQEYYEEIKSFQEEMLEMTSDIKYLSDIINYLGDLLPEIVERLLAQLLSKKIISLSDKDRQPIWEALQSFAKKNRRFKDAKWALPVKTVDKIENVAQKIIPNNPLYLYRYLFGKDSFSLYEEDEGDEPKDWQKQAQKLNDKRVSALQAIIDFGDTKLLFEFIDTIYDVYQAGVALSSLNNNEIEYKILPSFLNSSVENKNILARGYVVGKYAKLGDKWIDAIDFDLWSKEDIFQILLCLAYKESIRDKMGLHGMTLN
jgi:hypothetical protein